MFVACLLVIMREAAGTHKKEEAPTDIYGLKGDADNDCTYLCVGDVVKIMMLLISLLLNIFCVNDIF